MRVQPAGQYAQLDLTGDSGAAFPANPSDGQQFYRSDRNLVYFYKGSASSWLSMDRHEALLGLFSVTSDQGLGVFPLEADIYLEAMILSGRVATTSNGSNFWTIKLYGIAVGATTTVLTDFTTASDTAEDYIVHDVAYNAIISTSSYAQLLVSAAKTNSPGSYVGGSKLAYRIVG